MKSPGDDQLAHEFRITQSISAIAELCAVGRPFEIPSGVLAEHQHPAAPHEVRHAVEVQLAEKGFQPVPKEEADFLVAYFVDYKQRIGGSSVSMSAGRGSYGRYGGVGYSTSVSDYEEGYLTIDIIDPASDKKGSGSINTGLF